MAHFRFVLGTVRDCSGKGKSIARQSLNEKDVIDRFYTFCQHGKCMVQLTICSIQGQVSNNNETPMWALTRFNLQVVDANVS